MSASNYPGLAIPKSPPGTLERGWKRAAQATALRAAYDAVDLRDGKVCQVTGARLMAGAADDAKALERDHLAPRLVAPERIDDPDNILTVSRAVHRLLQASALLVVDKDGAETTSVSQIAGFAWNRATVPAGKEPFRLRRPRERVA